MRDGTFSGGGTLRVGTAFKGAVLLLLIGSGAVAQDGNGWVLYPPGDIIETSFACRFDLECIDAESCADTTYESTLDVRNTLKPGDPLTWAGQARMTDMNGDLPMVALRVDDSAIVVTAATDGASHLLTRSADGATRYSLHMPDVPMAITYLGTCEEVE